jgi:RNA polymerase sigma-70 factor (ECF subfamily)
MNAPSASASPTESVRTGRWSVVLAGGEEAPGALRQLCTSYAYPIFAWWRRAGLAAAKAAIATQASAARWLDSARPALEDAGAHHFRAWVHAQLPELATGGVKLLGPAPLTFDAAWAEGRYARESDSDADVLFERRWAVTVLEFTLAALEAEYRARGEGDFFRLLAPCLGAEPEGAGTYTEAAQKSGRSTGALRVAVFELRKRFRELLRAFVADTVANPAEIDAEMNALLAASR